MFFFLKKKQQQVTLSHYISISFSVSLCQTFQYEVCTFYFNRKWNYRPKYFVNKWMKKQLQQQQQQWPKASVAYTSIWNSCTLKMENVSNACCIWAIAFNQQIGDDEKRKMYTLHDESKFDMCMWVYTIFLRFF